VRGLMPCHTPPVGRLSCRLVVISRLHSSKPSLDKAFIVSSGAVLLVDPGHPALLAKLVEAIHRLHRVLPITRRGAQSVWKMTQGEHLPSYLPSPIAR
jgi:hypothetical protein